jgi:hypothetical protein
MPARKEQHPGFPMYCGLTCGLLLLVSLVSAGWVFGAGSPFEIEIGDLERGDAASKELKKPHIKPPAKKRGSKSVAVPRAKAEGRQVGDYVRYTIRPGDHIFKILTTRFGLSPAKAEELIPEIKRINGIVDTSGLQIGQTLLLPLTGKKVAAPQKTSPAPVQAPVPVPVLPAEAEKLAPENPPSPSPAVDEGMLRRAKEFWARLFPGRKPVEPAPGTARYPLLAGSDGKVIRIVPPGIPPVFGNLSGAGTEKWETVVADPANEKGFVKELLQAAGFATTEGGTPLEFGTGPKLSLKVDFTAAQRMPGAEIRKTILVLLEKNGCQALPKSLVSYLAAKDFRLLAWCDVTEKPPVSSAVQVRSVPPGKPEAMVDAVLEALMVKSSKDYPIEIVVGQSGAAPLSVTVGRYFEAGGKRFFLDFGNAAPNRATLFRLLELAGYQRIAVAGTDDFRSIAARIFEAVNIPAEYRKHVFTSLPDGRFALEVAGILFRRAGTGGEKIFLTDGPLEQPFFDLLNTVPWGTQ